MILWQNHPADGWTRYRVLSPVYAPPKPDVHAAWIAAVLMGILIVVMEFWR